MEFSTGSGGCADTRRGKILLTEEQTAPIGKTSPFEVPNRPRNCGQSPRLASPHRRGDRTYSPNGRVGGYQNSRSPAFCTNMTGCRTLLQWLPPFRDEGVPSDQLLTGISIAVFSSCAPTGRHLPRQIPGPFSGMERCIPLSQRFIA